MSARRSAGLLAALAVLLPVTQTQPRTAPPASYPQPPQALFKDLFVAVQSAQMYGDDKVFADLMELDHRVSQLGRLADSIAMIA